MGIADMLEILKMNLELRSNSRDKFLMTLIESSISAIALEGLKLGSGTPVRYKADEANIIIMYAAWLYRKRTILESENRYDSASLSSRGMPRMLRWNMNQMLFHQKMKESDDDD